MGALSIVWYVGLTLVSENILFDSIAALGLMIAFYYGITGFACVIYYRRELTNSAQELRVRGRRAADRRLVLLWLFYASCVDLSKPENSESGDSWLGVGPPLVIGLGFLLLGVVLMLLWRGGHPTSSAASARPRTRARSRPRRRRRRRPRGSPDGRAARRRL
jgi:hypothetical protein